MISIKVVKKVYKRKSLTGERLVLQCNDGTWKWREYTPFILTGRSVEVDKQMYDVVNALAARRLKEYKAMEAMMLSIEAQQSA